MNQINRFRHDLEIKLNITLPNLKEPSRSSVNIASSAEFASYIDATYLSPPFTKKNLFELCALAHKQHCASICIPPYFVELAKKELLNSPVKVCSVADFPFGSGSLKTKNQMIKTLINEGCDEVDVVMNYSLLKEGDFLQVFEQLKSMKASAPDHCIKVILETSYLSPQDIVHAVGLIDAAQLDYAKTSTGFSESGASVAIISLMNACSSARLKLKASGGIRSLDFAKKLIVAGAQRLGTSKTLDLILAYQHQEENYDT